MPVLANGRASMPQGALSAPRDTPTSGAQPAPWRDRIVGLERLPAHRLMDHAANWRLHPSAQHAALAGVLEEVGQVGALLVYQSERQGGLCVIDGHLRKSLEPHAVWPCLMLDVNDQEADLLLATYDPLAAMAARDERALAALLGGLHAEDARLAVLLSSLSDQGDRGGGTGAGGGGTPRVRDDAGGANDTLKVAATKAAIAAMREHYGVETGQVWGCGVHRVLCGDATRPEDYVKILAGAEVHAVVTDFPYAVDEAYEEYADTPEGLERLIAEALPIMREICPLVGLTPGNGNQWRYPKPSWTLAWFCLAGVGRTPWGFSCWQPILVYGADPYLAAGYGCRPDVLELTESADNELGHPCPKPVKMWSWLIERVTAEPAQTILDPFLGSGTSLIAAEQTHRRCFGIECDPGYVAVALDRWERATNIAPKLLAS